MTHIELNRIAGSFRDPSGGVFTDVHGRIFRTVNRCAKNNFDYVEATGLTTILEKEHLLIPSHQEEVRRFFPQSYTKNCVRLGKGVADEDEFEVAYVFSHPRIPFISYPYEWCFAQLQRAALLHLEIHIRSLEVGLTLSDSSAYNIQFQGADPVFIDRLSFIPYKDGMFWHGQKQFVEQFLTPLLLWSHTDIPPHEWYRGSMKGISAEHIRRILPFSRKLSFAYFCNITLPAFFERCLQDRPLASNRQFKKKHLPKEGFLFMLRQLERWISNLRAPRIATFWKDYSLFRSYSEEEMQRRHNFVDTVTTAIAPSMIWDVGCNNCEFLTHLLQTGPAYGIGFDIDHGALAVAYETNVHKKLPLLPLYMDLCNPSPGLGWNQCERDGLLERRNADMLLAMAVLHHIIIGNNVPVEMAVDYFLSLAPAGVIEWVPKSDPMVQNMLRSRDDIFSAYDIEYFRRLLQEHAVILKEEIVSDSGRTLFAYKVKNYAVDRVNRSSNLISSGAKHGVVWQDVCFQ